ncbi:MAG: 4-hydroxythreonine-4-phosphate dehydrogenase PdxA [Pyrinomonadaceae bacterium]
MIEIEIEKRLPIIGITMGDAAGIGPEVIVKALSTDSLYRKLRPVVIGDASVLDSTAKQLGKSIKVTRYLASMTPPAGAIEVIDLNNLQSEIALGTVSSDAGKAAGEYIEKAVELWSEGAIDAICTAPINKESLSAGGYDFPGHTEFLAKLTNTEIFAMSFFADKLRVVLLSTHLPLSEAIGNVKKDALIGLIKFTDKALSTLLKKNAKIAVAGLNPHASEGGKFGNEETTEIEPAIQECIELGIDVSGPYSPDTVFIRGFKGEFDAVIAHYHDQATIPVKALSFGSAVNVTLGLPLVRTSVDHGTAFDIAGKGIADESSMKAAIGLAAELAQVR